MYACLRHNEVEWACEVTDNHGNSSRTTIENSAKAVDTPTKRCETQISCDPDVCEEDETGCTQDNGSSCADCVQGLDYKVKLLDRPLSEMPLVEKCALLHDLDAELNTADISAGAIQITGNAGDTEVISVEEDVTSIDCSEFEFTEADEKQTEGQGFEH